MKKIILFALFVAVQSYGQCWNELSAGADYTVGIAQNGTLWAWGLNSSGQLGDGTTVDKWQTLNQSSTQTNWAKIATGRQHTLAIKSDGTLWAWGNNAFGNLGLGTTSNVNTPTQVGTDTNWSSITASENHSLAIKTDGTLWAWGNNEFGQLGDGTFVNKNTPIQIGTSTDWASIKTGGGFSLGLKTNGNLFAWGSDTSGQLGNGGSNGNSTTPVAVVGTNFSKIECGRISAYAIKTDGTLWSWGSNTYGNLGQGNTSSVYNAPTQVGAETNWIKIVSGPEHFLALKSNNSLWSCGRNHRGQLGNNTTTFSNVLIQVNSSVSYSNAFAGNSANSNGTYGFSLAIKSDGNLQSWGDNDRGQLGIGSRFNNRLVPQDVSCPTSFILGLTTNDLKHLEIYPNPTSSTINIFIENTNNFEVELFDAVGKKVATFNNQKQLDISNLKKGMYVVKITDLDNNVLKSQKIIKN